MKLWEKVNKEIATCLGKSDKLAYKYVILCHSEKEKTTGVIFGGTIMINMPDDFWPWNTTVLQRQFKSCDLLKSDNMLNCVDGYEKAYIKSKVPNDRYKELLILQSETGKECKIAYDNFKKFFECDSDLIEIYIKNEKSPVYIKWMEFTIGVIMPVYVPVKV